MTQPVFNNTSYNYSVPTINPAPVVPVAPGATPMAAPTQQLGTNPGLQKIAPQYQTTSPTQSSYYWGSQTSGSGTQPTPTTPTPAQAWGTGNQGIIPQFNVDQYIKQMLSPSWQAATQQTLPYEYGVK